MLKDNLKKELLDSLLAIGAGLLFTITVANTFPILLMLLPIPFVVVGVKHRTFLSAVGLFILTLILIPFIGLESAAIIFIIMIVPTQVLTLGISQRVLPQKTIIFSALAFFVGLIVVSLGLNILSSINTQELIKESVLGIMDLQVEMLEDMSLSNLELGRAVETLRSNYMYLLQILPAILFVSGLLFSYLNYILSGLLLETFGIASKRLARLKNFSLSKGFTTIALAILLLVLVNRFFPSDAMELSLANLLVLVGVAFLMQGLGVLSFILDKLKLKRIARVGLVILIILLSPLLVIIAIIGGLDTVLDFRKLRNKA